MKSCGDIKLQSGSVQEANSYLGQVMTSSYSYLGQVMTSGYDDPPKLIDNG